MADGRMTDDLIDAIVRNLRHLPVFGPTDTETRDEAIDLITHLRERAERAEAKGMEFIANCMDLTSERDTLKQRVREFARAILDTEKDDE